MNRGDTSDALNSLSILSGHMFVMIFGKVRFFEGFVRKFKGSILLEGPVLLACHRADNGSIVRVPCGGMWIEIGVPTDERDGSRP